MFTGGPQAPRLARLIYHFPNFVRLFRALWIDARVPMYRKAIPMLAGFVCLLMGLAYFMWKVDLIWDFLPILGKLDDVAVVAALTLIPAGWLFVRVAPPEIVAEHVETIDKQRRQHSPN